MEDDLPVANIFVSYSRVDVGFVRDLHEFLTVEGREVWVDWEDIPPASDWERDIYESIDGAESFVFVASPASLASEYCGRELRHAGERGKRIVPLAIDGAAPDEAPARCASSTGSGAARTTTAMLPSRRSTRALDTDLVWRGRTRDCSSGPSTGTNAPTPACCSVARISRRPSASLDENAGKDPRPTELQQRYLSGAAAASATPAHAARRRCPSRSRSPSRSPSPRCSSATRRSPSANSARSLALAADSRARARQRPRHRPAARPRGLSPPARRSGGEQPDLHLRGD